MGKNDSILIIEDSSDIREAMKMFLELENYSVFLAATGNEALTLLKSAAQFSLIFLDIKLPDMMAPEFLEKIDKAGLLGKNPIVMCSGAADLRQMALPRGVVGILPKPFDVKRLLSVVKTFARNPEND